MKKTLIIIALSAAAILSIAALSEKEGASHPADFDLWETEDRLISNNPVW